MLEDSAAEPERGETRNVIAALKLQNEIARLERTISDWVDDRNPEMLDALRWQFSGGAKYYRPVTLFCCSKAVHGSGVGEVEISRAVIVELIHNMTLIVDDILDKSRYRRKKLTLHCRFGTLPALMTSGYVVAEAYRIAGADADAVALISELVSRLGVAECLQWRLRSQPLGVEDWRKIATEDTGSMFEVCACLGTRDERLRRFGQLLGLLYHGCDDVADVRGVRRTRRGRGGRSSRWNPDPSGFDCNSGSLGVSRLLQSGRAGRRRTCGGVPGGIAGGRAVAR